MAVVEIIPAISQPAYGLRQPRNVYTRLVERGPEQLR